MAEAQNSGTTQGSGILGGNTAMVFDGISGHRNFGDTVKFIFFKYKNIKEPITN